MTQQTPARPAHEPSGLFLAGMALFAILALATFEWLDAKRSDHSPASSVQATPAAATSQASAK